MSNEQDYIPGTQVIRNLVDRDENHPFGTADQEHLARAETLRVSRRLNELRQRPITEVKPFSFAHMRSIHQHLFQDVYSWAGEPRRVPMTKRVTSYAEPAEMNALLRAQYAALGEQNFLQNISSREEFTRQLASFWGEINHAHAFREGNTRSQTVFFEQLAHHAGWSLDVSRLSPGHQLSVYTEFVDARFEHQRIRDASGGAVVPGSTGALSAQEAALDLANVLYRLIEPDRSPEGRLRRSETGLSQTGETDPVRIISQDPDRTTKLLNRSGIAVTPDGFLDFGDSPASSPADNTVNKTQPAVPTTAQLKARYAQHPELRTMRLDPYRLADDNEHSAGGSAGTDYQL